MLERRGGLVRVCRLCHYFSETTRPVAVNLTVTLRNREPAESMLCHPGDRSDRCSPETFPWRVACRVAGRVLLFTNSAIRITVRVCS